MQCEILATGSAGNAVVLGGTILIDCGVSYKLLAPSVPDLQLVLLTHIHSDHFRRATIRRLAAERPRLRWGCGPWLVQPLGELGVSRRQIDALKDDGCEFIDLPIDRRGTNPLHDLKLILRYCRTIRAVRPDIVLTYTSKSSIYGGIACRAARAKLEREFDRRIVTEAYLQQIERLTGEEAAAR